MNRENVFFIFTSLSKLLANIEKIENFIELRDFFEDHGDLVFFIFEEENDKQKFLKFQTTKTQLKFRNECSEQFINDAWGKKNIFIEGERIFYTDYKLIMDNVEETSLLFGYSEGDVAKNVNVKDMRYFNIKNSQFSISRSEVTSLEEVRQLKINYQFYKTGITIYKEQSFSSNRVEEIDSGVTFPGLFWSEAISLRRMSKRPALFLDRDGILVEDSGYLDNPETVKPIESIIPILRKFKELNFLIIVLTNQSGVARSYFTMNEYEKINDKIREWLNSHNITIDDFFCCPYFEGVQNPSYDKKSFLRKPSPGMMFKACEKYAIDLSKSTMIGDKQSDQLNLFGPSYFFHQGTFVGKNIADFQKK